MSREQLAENVFLSEDERSVVILDQSRLPQETVCLSLDNEQEMFDAIKTLKVRGAPAIGIFAGYCLYVLAQRIAHEIDQAADDLQELPARVLYNRLSEQAAYLNSSRPTAVNLKWALDRVMACTAQTLESTQAMIAPFDLVQRIGDEVEAIQREDIEMCRRIAEYGLSLLKEGDGILTHCNAGPLATSRYGTALGPILLGHDQGMDFKVFADETRPLMQGARLTAYELNKAGVDVTLICDNMASTVMKNGWVQACLVGCDRVAANGDTANKIGTSGVAILAKHYGIPFYVLGPGSTIDMDCPTGDGITIELRDPQEVRGETAPEEVPCYNPSFDVTDHSLITAIITEKGICYPPFDESLKEKFGV